MLAPTGTSPSVKASGVFADLKVSAGTHKGEGDGGAVAGASAGAGGNGGNGGKRVKNRTSKWVESYDMRMNSSNSTDDGGACADGEARSSNGSLAGAIGEGEDEAAVKFTEESNGLAPTPSKRPAHRTQKWMADWDARQQKDAEGVIPE
jgi:hypothetical protein